ncbi:MAG: hypothetical protein ACYDH9_04165 [Limisphaerales bacterium]
MGPTNPSRARFYARIIRHFLVILAVSLWFGGFTFYSLVVIHTGHRIFGGSREVGFLTQQVTRWLNLAGVAALLILLWNTMAGWHGARPGLRWGLAASLFLMVAVQVSLFTLHPMLDRLLDAQTHRILDRTQFVHLHHAYVNLSTTQWLATLVHLWLVLAAWSRAERGPATTGTP